MNKRVGVFFLVMVVAALLFFVAIYYGWRTSDLTMAEQDVESYKGISNILGYSAIGITILDVIYLVVGWFNIAKQKKTKPTPSE